MKRKIMFFSYRNHRDRFDSTDKVDGAKLRTKYGVQPGIGPLTPSGTGNTGSGGSGTASPESQASLPSQDELSRIDYCGNVVYDRGERRLILGNGYVTFDSATEAPSN